MPTTPTRWSGEGASVFEICPHHCPPLPTHSTPSTRPSTPSSLFLLYILSLLFLLFQLILFYVCTPLTVSLDTHRQTQADRQTVHNAQLHLMRNKPNYYQNILPFIPVLILYPSFQCYLFSSSSFCRTLKDTVTNQFYILLLLFPPLSLPSPFLSTVTIIAYLVPLSPDIQSHFLGGAVKDDSSLDTDIDKHSIVFV